MNDTQQFYDLMKELGFEPDSDNDYEWFENSKGTIILPALANEIFELVKKREQIACAKGKIRGWELDEGADRDPNIAKRAREEIKMEREFLAELKEQENK